MVVGLFIGMAVIVVILFVVTYVEIVRIWRDLDSMRREMRRMRKEFDDRYVRAGRIKSEL